MRLIPTTVTLVLLAVFASWASGAGNNLRDDSLDRKIPAGNVQVSAILISASSEKGETDARLSQYAGNLRRILRFESFAFIGQGSTRIQLPGTGDVALPRGHSVKLQAAHYGEGVVWLRVIWMEGARERMNVVYAKCERGKPIILGGSDVGGENLALIVTPK